LARLKPFRAVRYNTRRAGNLRDVVAPPYDIIPKRMQDELYRRSRSNIVRLILNRITPKDTAADNRYTRSRKFFDKWLTAGILERDAADSFYIYSQSYKRGDKPVEQVGFIGLMALEKGSKDKVLPHENTLAAPKKDRLDLMRAVKANLSPIFILHDDSAVTRILKNFCAANKPAMDVKLAGVRHAVWQMDDPRLINDIRARMESGNLFIADGHHRYAVAKMYAEESGAEDSKYMMVYFVEASEKMLTVLPTHRLIKDLGNIKKSDIIERLGKFFDVKKVSGLNKMISALDLLITGHAFGLYLGRSGFYVLKLKNIAASDNAIKDKPRDWKRLDVSILHLFIFQRLLGVSDTDENIDFSKSPLEAVKAVDSGAFKAAFFLNPTKVSEVKHIAKLGERMPRKSTYFYPKPLSGLVINKFSG